MGLTINSKRSNLTTALGTAPKFLKQYSIPKKLKLHLTIICLNALSEEVIFLIIPNIYIEYEKKPAYQNDALFVDSTRITILPLALVG